MKKSPFTPILGDHDFKVMPTARGVRVCAKCARREVYDPNQTPHLQYRGGRGYTQALQMFPGACDPALELGTVPAA